jgi:Tfp pilus tip-associated adhesin PilY1
VTDFNQSVTIVMDSDKNLIARFADPEADNDGDGSPASLDCNDNDPDIRPGAPEYCDGVDSNCNGMDDEPCTGDDEDRDGDGYSTNQGDCNDNPNDDLAPTIHPGAYDVPGDGIDQDCYDGDRPVQEDEYTCVVPDETPLETQIKAAAPLVMFLIDDSGSMDFEVMTDEPDGDFEGNKYLYPYDWGDSLYYPSSWFMDSYERRKWRSQWVGVNRMYFNPDVEYTPWPRWNTMSTTYGSPGFNADPDDPRMNPVNSRTLSMSRTFFAVDAVSVANQTVTVTKIENDTDRKVVADAMLLVNIYNQYDWYLVDDSSSSGDGIDGFYVEPLNDWGTYTDYGDTGPYGDTCRTNYNDGRAATWYFKVPGGTYNVYAHIPNAGEDMTREVQYTIAHNGQVHDYGDFTGTAGETFDQHAHAGAWHQIGNNLVFHSTAVDRVYIPVAHYFTMVGSEIYLVVVDDQHDGNVNGFTYYRFDDSDGDERVDDLELTNVTGSEPASIRPDGTYAEVRQNFANWFSFYRKREYTAKAAISQVVEEIDNAKVGMAVLNNRSDYNHPVVPIDMDNEDQTALFLNWLYSINSYGGTPLRRGLQDVGQYFDQNATYDGGNDGEVDSVSPWADEDAGGGCQRAFVIAMTDGYYNDEWDDIESPLRGSDDDADGSNRLGQDSDYDQGVFAGLNPSSYQTTLADIAMYYYENDLVPTLTNKVFSYDFDMAPHQHMVTYGVAFGVTGTVDPSAYPNCLPKCDPNDKNEAPCPELVCPTWPIPVQETKTVIDDLYHATVNGRGGFFSAGDPEQLKRSLVSIFEDIDESTASGSSVAVNAQELQGDSALYQAIYVSGDWTGDVKAKPLDPDTGLVVQETDENDDLVDKVLWSAAEQIKPSTWSSRKILTFKDDTKEGVVFTYDALSSAQKALLDSDPDIAAAMVDYLKGDTSQEERNMGIFRDRLSILGDIVHASPLPYRWDTDLPGVIFVGANDGMLHVLDELTGNERFAYVPNLVFANLKELTIDPYVHKYFVDNEPYVAKLGSFGSTILVGGLGRGGRGYYCLDIGSVSNPALDAELNVNSIVKWEYPVNSDPENKAVDPDMGYSFSQAYIVNSAAGWVVIFGNGYDSANGEAVLYAIPINSDGSYANPLNPVRKIHTGKGDSDPNCNGLSTPALVDVDLDGSVDFAYAGDLLGNMWKFDLRDANVNNWAPAYNSAADQSGTWEPIFQAKNASEFRQPITTRPEVMRHCVRGQDGYIVLFGTGRFLGLNDFAGASAVQSIYGIWDWGEAWENLNSSFYSEAKRNPVDKYLGAFDENRQLTNLVGNTNIPETDQTIYLLDLTDVAVGDTVRIGSRTFTAAYLTDEDEYKFYNAAGLQEVISATLANVSVEATAHQVILRSNPPGDTLSIVTSGGITVEPIDLKVSLLNQGIIYNQNDYIVLSDNPIDWFDPSNGTGQHVGWYFDLPGYSERLINNVILRGGILYTIPTKPSDSPCEAGGTSIIYALNACSGGRSTQAVFDIDGDFRVNNADLINIGTPDNPMWVAPTGLRRSELLYTPSILTIPGTGTDALHFSQSGGNLQTEIAITEKLGFLYWRTW